MSLQEWLAADPDRCAEWRPIPGFDGYEISDLGRVRSWRPCTRSKSLPYVLNPGIGDAGYPVVTLQGPTKKALRRVHRLVGEAFLGPRPAGMETRHLNGDKLDNRVANLRYGTKGENAQDAVRHGDNHNVAKTHCPQNHPYDDMNTRVVRAKGRKPFRICKACEAERRRSKRSQGQAERVAS